MSLSGQQRSSRPRSATSGLPQSTDIARLARLVRFVPIADMSARHHWTMIGCNRIELPPLTARTGAAIGLVKTCRQGNHRSLTLHHRPELGSLVLDQLTARVHLNPFDGAGESEGWLVLRHG